MIKAIRGTRDLLPPETALWNFVEAAVRDVFRAYNFQEIRTPIFESTELFARGVGEFGATIVFAGSVRGETQTLTLGIYDQLQVNFDVAIALGILLVVLSAGVLGAAKLLTARRNWTRERPAPLAESRSVAA